MIASTSQPILSVCIPTYNRAGSVEALVRTLLSCPDSRIEVVVLDNASTDDTLARLNAVQDSRLSVHANATNRGVTFNALNVLDKAGGRYCVLLLDKDGVHAAGLEDFLEFLNARPATACGYCEYGQSPDTPPLNYSRGSEALGKIGYLGHHPTGYFFNLAMLRSIDFTKRFSDFSYVGHFPFDFIFAELALLGDAWVYNKPVFFPESIDQAARHKSIGTNASVEDAFFSPTGRLKTTINFARHIRTLPIADTQKEALIAKRFVSGLAAATLGYRSVMASPQLCAHYHISNRPISSFELGAVALRFYRQFIQQLMRKSNRLELVETAKFHWTVSKLLFRKFSRKGNTP